MVNYINKIKIKLDEEDQKLSKKKTQFYFLNFIKNSPNASTGSSGLTIKYRLWKN